MTEATDSAVNATGDYSAPKSVLRFALPLAIFAVLAGFLFVGLGLNPREVPSPFIGKPAPPFRLAQLAQQDQSFSPSQMQGQVWLFNVWASWCVACRIEHPLLVDLAKKDLIPIIGLNYKDRRTQRWLARAIWRSVQTVGCGHRWTGRYRLRRLWRTRNVVIDKTGVIRFKQIGPITEDAWRNKILPRGAALRQS